MVYYNPPQDIHSHEERRHGPLLKSLTVRIVEVYNNCQGCPVGRPTSAVVPSFCWELVSGE